MAQPPFLREACGAVRFWVSNDGSVIGASISRETRHFLLRLGAKDDVLLEIGIAFASVIEAAVALRLARGSIEPVMLREFDLRVL